MALALAFACVAAPATAHAAFPGQNGRIAFGNDNGDLASINPDGTGEAQLTGPDERSDSNPAWSPDGRRVAFQAQTYDPLSDTYSDLELYLVNANGSGITQLTNNGVDDHSPAWSPDGQRLAFARTKPASPPFASGYGDDIYVREANGAEALVAPCTPLADQLCSGQHDLSWSPNGQKIALDWNDWYFENEIEPAYYPASSEIHVVNADGSGRTAVTDFFEFDWAPDWSPGGTRIVFRHDGDIWTIDADGTDPAEVVPNTCCGGSYDPSWSPDGQRIAYVRSGNLHTVKPDGTDAQTLAMSARTRNGAGTSWQRRTGVTAYPRPGGASPLRVALAPAFDACTSPNATHAAPLALPSCSPPSMSSPILTMSSTGAGSGFVRLDVLPGNIATAADEADIRIRATATDVKCGVFASGCTGVGADYTGRVILRIGTRATDAASGAFATTPATVQDADLSFPIDCTATVSTAGSTCTLDTTIDAVMPGFASERQRLVLAIPSATVTDAGPDGDVGAPTSCPPTCGTGDEKPHLDQGVFLP